MKIEITEKADKNDLATISKGLQSYNRKTIGKQTDGEVLNFAVFARDDDGVIIGGVRAVAFWNWLTIELLWLKDENRGLGLGTQLMEEAEKYAMENNYYLSIVETASFQAHDFYEKLGYSVFAELDDFPKGYKNYYMKKVLAKI
ncbi:MAG: GNAT family N-acetyltransferase [Gammaproteobacteria bacterium]|nr:GNAT family N-acetyltransferase [Gammaproteobacteria bacterium]